jgi:predicted RNA-binding protein associated with RNAse of E/G family
VKVVIKKIKFTTINKTYTEFVRDYRGPNCFATQYPNPDGKRIFLIYYFVKEGYTISKVFTKKGEFLYYYCDLMEMQQIGSMKYVMTDLLIDLIVYPDDHYHIVDLDEFVDSLEKDELTKRQQIHTLKTLHEMVDLQKQRKLIPDFIADAKMYNI